MTPKEKAEEFVDKFNLPSGLMTIERINCASILVNELIKYAETFGDMAMLDLREFEEIKAELEKL